MEKRLNVPALLSAMEQAGLNPAALAKHLDVSREAVSKWLSAEAFPRPDKLLGLAQLVNLKFDQLVTRTAGAREPVVAFRKQGSYKTTEEHVRRAKEIGYSLRPLAKYLPFDQLRQPPTLKQPTLDYAYVQHVAADVRKDIGVAMTDAVDFRLLIRKFGELQAVLVPVLWGEKDRHENALHIYLPDSMTTWVYVNLDSKIHDFKFWMTHELGHIFSPSLIDSEIGEDFADAFAGALLFPEVIAKATYRDLMATQNVGRQINLAKQIAEYHVISPITVYREVNKFANENKLAPLDLEKSIYGAANNLSKNYSSVSATLFNREIPEPNQYIKTTEELFESPFFMTVKQYLAESGKQSSYLQAILDIALLDAKALYQAMG